MIPGIFPFIFRQIFGDYRITLLRRALTRDGRGISMEGSSVGTLIINAPSDPASTVSAIEKGAYLEAIRKANPRDLLAIYGESNSELAQRIFTRSGVYLLAGVAIAFIGLIWYSYRTPVFAVVPGTPESGIARITWDHLLALLPGLGVLFFIELIAFFFLRQYRSSMDEFRYFDAVRRSREDNLVVLKMFAENPDRIPTKDVLASMNIYSNAGKLGKDKTTEMLEARRMQKDELSVFEKFVDAISAFKDLKRSEEKKK